jgi:hypothetical protein
MDEMLYKFDIYILFATPISNLRLMSNYNIFNIYFALKWRKLHIAYITHMCYEPRLTSTKKNILFFIVAYTKAQPTQTLYCERQGAFLDLPNLQHSITTVSLRLFHTNINYFRGTVKKYIYIYEGGSAKCETNKIN